MTCVLCDDVDPLRLFEHLLAGLREQGLTEQDLEDAAGANHVEVDVEPDDVDWVELKRKVAYDLGLEGELTLTTFRTHLFDHLNWSRADA